MSFIVPNKKVTVEIKGQKFKLRPLDSYELTKIQDEVSQILPDQSIKVDTARLELLLVMHSLVAVPDIVRKEFKQHYKKEFTISEECIRKLNPEIFTKLVETITNLNKITEEEKKSFRLQLGSERKTQR